MVGTSKIKNKKEEILIRIRKVKGQVGGVERMIEKGKPCLEIVQQIAAVRAALSKIATLFLAQESCRSESRNKKGFEKIIDKLINLN